MESAWNGPWKEQMYREKANPVETTETPMLIPKRNDSGANAKHGHTENAEGRQGPPGST